MIVFDLETIRLAKDMAPDSRPIGWERDRLKFMGVAWGCAWRSCFETIEHFDEHNLSKLADFLEEAALVISFNGIRFDVPLLSGYLNRQIRISRQCDLFAIVQASYGKRLGLAALAVAILARTKTGFGGHAPELFRSGRIADLATYCARDVALTRDLFFLAKTRGFLFSPHGKRIYTPVPDGLSSLQGPQTQGASHAT